MNAPDLHTEKGRAEFRAQVLLGLGGEWPTPPALDVSIVESFEKDGQRVEKVRYQVEPHEYVSAYVLSPLTRAAKKLPAIAVWHQHNGEFPLGKSEPSGMIGNPIHHAAPLLVREGFIVVCPDAIGFEERRDTIQKQGDYERFLFLKYVVEGKSLAWKNILDMKRAVDYLCTRLDLPLRGYLAPGNLGLNVL